MRTLIEIRYIIYFSITGAKAAHCVDRYSSIHVKAVTCRCHHCARFGIRTIKLLRNFAIYFSVDSVAETVKALILRRMWLRLRDLGSNLKLVALLSPWIRPFTTIISACGFEQASKLTRKKSRNQGRRQKNIQGGGDNEKKNEKHQKIPKNSQGDLLLRGADTHASNQHENLEIDNFLAFEKSTKI